MGTCYMRYRMDRVQGFAILPLKIWSGFWSQRAHQRARVVSNSDSTMIPYKEKTFDELVVDGLRGSMPGAYSSSRPKSTFNKTLYRNVFSDRARDGFRYWLIERPKPTNFGKYGMGSYKTVLGIGNAPRT
ncbi:uncharacterized protein LOC111106199 isoform X1 [Crassostrea virginica]